MSKTTKEIRVSLNTAAAQQTAADFAILSVIKGVDYEAALVSALDGYIKKHGKPLKRGTWLSQTDLIEKLQSDYDITTNSQTLMNYRNEGRLNNAYCSDGKKKVYYLLENVVQVFTEPRERRQSEKATAG